MTDARARVEAWIKFHNIRSGYDAVISDDAAEALVAAVMAYGAAQRAEEREACALIAVGMAWVGTDMKYPWSQQVTQTAGDIATAIRARREGPGGAQ